MRFNPLQEGIEPEGRSGEKGWALLGLLLALSIMSIIMTSSLTPIVGIQVQREKEEEMIYRGEAMAKGIARYYNNGNLNGIQLLVPPPYGFLTELKKLRDGFTIGVREVKFIRPSAIIDPMTGLEWEPVRARDPRIMKFLQAWAAETQQPIPQQYLLLAGPPEKLHLAPSSGEQPATPTPPVATPGAQPPQAKPKPPANDNLDDDDDDDDDDDEVEDPLAHIFGSGSFGQQGSSSTPIIGVAPKRRGASLRKLYGLDKYEDWIFIYIPPFGQNRPGVNVRPGQPNPNSGRPRTSQ
jgi:hypothetical protein